MTPTTRIVVAEMRFVTSTPPGPIASLRRYKPKLSSASLELCVGTTSGDQCWAEIARRVAAVEPT